MIPWSWRGSGSGCGGLLRVGRSLPVLEEAANLSDGFRLFIYSGGGGFLHVTREEVKGVDEAICVRGGWLRYVVMAELNGVGDKGGLVAVLTTWKQR